MRAAGAIEQFAGGQRAVERDRHQRALVRQALARVGQHVRDRQFAGGRFGEEVPAAQIGVDFDPHGVGLAEGLVAAVLDHFYRGRGVARDVAHVGDGVAEFLVGADDAGGIRPGLRPVNMIPNRISVCANFISLIIKGNPASGVSREDL